MNYNHFGLFLPNYKINRYGERWCITLSLSMLDKTVSRNIFIIFIRKKVSDISYDLSLKETICKKCQRLLAEKNKKHIINLSSLDFAQKVVKVNITKTRLFKYIEIFTTKN